MKKVDKERVVADLTERLQNSDTLIVADYRGLTMTQIDDLRGKLLEHGARFAVVKNTLTRRAAEAAGADALLALLEGPTAIAFLESDGDSVAVAKALSDAVLGAVTAPLQTIVGLFTAPLQDIYGLLDARVEQLREEGDTSEAAAPDPAEPEAGGSEPQSEEAPAEEPVAEGEPAPSEAESGPEPQSEATPDAGDQQETTEPETQTEQEDH